MKKEFPFSLALVLAFLLHILLGFVLKYNPLLIAATPGPSSTPEPLSVRFVEVPPDAKAVPEVPKTRNVSDANYKAGPLEKSEERREQRESSIAPQGGDGRPAVVAGRTKLQPTVLPPIQSPDLRRSDANEFAESDHSKLLAKSLENLDRYIQPGTGSAAGEAGGPSGDPGSGVFFDTQGFDLGPWGNRVVAIVKSNWIIPVAAQLGTKGVVGVSFQVDRQGRILNPKIISTSKTPSFDQAAVNALKSSDPLPPLPADFPRPLLPAVFRFYYNTPVPE